MLSIKLPARDVTEENYIALFVPLFKEYGNGLGGLKVTHEDFREAGSLVASQAFFGCGW